MSTISIQYSIIFVAILKHTSHRIAGQSITGSHLFGTKFDAGIRFRKETVQQSEEVQ